MLKRLFVTLIALAFVSPVVAEDVILPQIVQGPNWTTRIYIINRAQEDARVSLRFIKSSGSPWSELQFWWRFSGVYDAKSDGRISVLVQAFSCTEINSIYSPAYNQTDDKTGYLILEDLDTEYLHASATLEYHPGGRAKGIVSSVGVLPSSLAKAVTSPFDSSTAIAIANPSFHSVTFRVRVTISNSQGFESLRDYEFTLGPREHQALFLKEIISYIQYDNEEDLFGFFFVLCWDEIGDKVSSMVLNFKDGKVSSAPVHFLE